MKTLFIEKANVAYNNKYDYSKVEYKNNKTKIIIICPVHGEFITRPDNHLTGRSGCPKCKTEKFVSRITSDNKEFIERANKIHNNKYDYSKVNYINTHKKVIIICPDHGEFEQEPNAHLCQKSGCPYCFGTIKLTTEEFIERSIAVHGSKYDYSKVEYVNAKVKVIIICPIHGEFEQLPGSHIFQKSGCPKCRYVSNGLNKRSTTKEFINKSNIVHNKLYDYSKVNYITKREKIIIICSIHGEFEQAPEDHLNGSGCPICQHHISSYETEISEFLKLNNIDHEQSNRSIIKPYELDIVIPEHKIAIEFNGIYWHSEQMLRKSSNNYRKYHYTKFNMCNNAGYHLMTIFEPEWINKSNIIKSMILAKCNIYEKNIGARKGVIKEVSVSDAKLFMNDNHIQGFANGIHLGLYFNDELLSMITFDKIKGQYNLSRFVNRLNTLVYGAFSKLLNYFIKQYNPESIITFADKRYFKGTVYNNNGFNFIHEVDPSYYYFKQTSELLHKRAFQKKRLEKMFVDYNNELTEYQNCLNNGYDRIWDCGKIKYELIL